MAFDLTKIFPSSYEIRVAGRIAAERADWFSGLDWRRRPLPRARRLRSCQAPWPIRPRSSVS